ncbi:hypothetical protein [Caulobacter sp.]
MMLVTVALGAMSLKAPPSAAQVTPVGARLEEGRSCYVLQIKAADALRPIGRTLQIVRRERVDGRQVIRVIVHQQLQNGAFDVRDDFLLATTDLRPLRYESRSHGKVTVDVTYRADGVSGYRVTKDGDRNALSAALEGPVWEGNLWGAVFAALPLSQDAQLTLPFWHYEKGLGRFAIQVVGEDTVAVSSGDVAAWVVEASDGSGPSVTYRFAKDNGRELAYTMGGFTQTLGGDCAGLPDA